jgi:uncharacterized cupin superfamily protein
MHDANEELLIVLDGALELRTPEGSRPVARGAVVAFPAGLAGAHRLCNVSDSPKVWEALRSSSGSYRPGHLVAH